MIGRWSTFSSEFDVAIREALIFQRLSWKNSWSSMSIMFIFFFLFLLHFFIMHLILYHLWEFRLVSRVAFLTASAIVIALIVNGTTLGIVKAISVKCCDVVEVSIVDSDIWFRVLAESFLSLLMPMEINRFFTIDNPFNSLGVLLFSNDDFVFFRHLHFFFRLWCITEGSMIFSATCFNFNIRCLILSISPDFKIASSI